MRRGDPPPWGWRRDPHDLQRAGVLQLSGNSTLVTLEVGAGEVRTVELEGTQGSRVQVLGEEPLSIPRLSAQTSLLLIAHYFQRPFFCRALPGMDPLPSRFRAQI